MENNINQIANAADLSPKQANKLKGINNKPKGGQKAESTVPNLRNLPRRLAASKSNQ